MLSSSSYRFPGLVLALTFLAYSTSLFNGYVWDDIPLIVHNTLFEAPFDPRTAFFADLWAGADIGEEAASGYFRPLMVASLWLDQALGASAMVAHAHSMGWHLMAVTAAFVLGRQVVGREVAAVGALCFALHPVQSEAVLWVAARNDLMAAALGLWALAAVTSEKPRPVLALVLTAAAMASKESVVLLPVAAGLLLVAAPRSPDRSPRGLAARVWPLVAGIALVLGLRAAVGVGAARGPSVEGVRLVAKVLPSLVGWVGWKVAAPWPLSIGYALEYIGRIALPVRVLGAVFVGAGSAWVVWRGSRSMRLGLAWAVLFGAPVAWALCTTAWMGERYLYLPMLGMGWTLGAVGERVLSGREPVQRLRLWLVWGTLGAGLVGVRAQDWRDDTTLWAAAVRTTPSPFTNESLGHVQWGVGGPEAALPTFVEALDDEKPLPTGCVPLLRAAVGTQKMVRAAQLGSWAASIGCGGPEFDGWRAVTLASTGRWDMLQSLLDTAKPDRDGRIVVAEAALALHLEDVHGLAELERDWSGDRALRPQAEAIVSNARGMAPTVAPVTPRR